MTTMTDLEIAKTELYEEKLTLAIVKDGHLLFSTKSHRISGVLEAIDQCGTALEGASLADRVAGKALALLCAYAKIKEVYATVLSRKAQVVFKQNHIKYNYRELVENVLDPAKADLCPFEKAATTISDPAKAYVTFRTLLDQLRTSKT
jgi:hypothetical protein